MQPFGGGGPYRAPPLGTGDVRPGGGLERGGGNFGGHDYFAPHVGQPRFDPLLPGGQPPPGLPSMAPAPPFFGEPNNDLQPPLQGGFGQPFGGPGGGQFGPSGQFGPMPPR